MTEGRIITYETYKQFAKKYGIRLTTLTGKKRTMQQLARQIYKIDNGYYKDNFCKYSFRRHWFSGDNVE